MFATYLGDGPATSEYKSLYDRAAMSFTTVAFGMMQLKGHFRVKAVADDISAILEQISYGVVGHRATE